MMQETYPLMKDIICVRGGGDLATGVVAKLVHAGYRVVICEIDQPTAIRTTVALSTCLFEGEYQVEDVRAKHVSPDVDALLDCWNRGIVPVVIDPKAMIVYDLRPGVVVDAILAKKNLGTTIDMANIVIGMGPGFVAGEDCDAVIETMRGHKLGRVIYSGPATPNTGVPGEIGGKSNDRVLRAPVDGIMKSLCKLGDHKEQGEAILEVEGQQVVAPFSGVVRGLLPDGLEVFKGMKIGDIDPRTLDPDAIYTISDKARSLGGAVMDAISTLSYRNLVKDVNRE